MAVTGSEIRQQNTTDRAGISEVPAPLSYPFPNFPMGAMKELLSSLQEAMQEYDPVAFEEGRRIVEAAQAAVLQNPPPADF